MVNRRGQSANEKLRDRLLRDRGLVQEKDPTSKRTKRLLKAVPRSEIKTPLAGLVEYYYEGATIREILSYFSIAQIHKETRIARSTLTKWKDELGIE